MKPTTREWIDKAEGDYWTMEREIRARKNPNYDAVCFHGQQCVEKYLKARLCESDVSFAKTHDLVALLDKTRTVEPFWSSFADSLAHLSSFAVRTRYPGDSATEDDAVRARSICRSFRKAAQAAFPVV